MDSDRGLMKKLLLILILIAIALSVIVHIQFKPWLEGYLIASLKQQGLKNVEMNIASVGLGGANLEKIQFGQDELFVIEDVALKYTLDDLRHKRIDEILLNNVLIKAVQKEDSWIVYGLEGLTSDNADTSPLSFISLGSEQLEAVPFRTFGIRESLFNISADFGTLDIPLNARWQKYDSPNLIYNSDLIAFKREDLEVNISKPEMELLLKDGAWAGDWTVESLSTNNVALPIFTSSGSVSANDKELSAKGEFTSDNNVYQGDFSFNYTPENSTSMVFNSNVNVDMPIQGGRLKMPVTLNWTPFDQLHIMGQGGTLNWKSGELSFSADDASINVVQKDALFTGIWKAGKISVIAPIAVPILWGSGKVNVDGTKINADGMVISTDERWKSNFSLQLGANKNALNGLRIKSAQMPWKQGRLKIKDVWIPFEQRSTIDVNLEIERVNLAELMEMLTGNKIQATGVVSGFAKVKIDANGNITVQKGNLGADGPGTIVMPPETIPADNQQVNLVKDIMQDLQYEILNITADNDENGELTLKLTVEGKNPKVYDGRPVKLNINLTGNLLEFIEQNMMIFSKPEKFLKKETKK